VTAAYRTLNTELGLPAQPVRPSEFVPRLASELDVSNRVHQRARTLAEAAESAGVTTGVQPAGFAAACLYKAGGERSWKVSQAEVAEAANVSSTTVRTHRDTLEKVTV